MLDAIATGVTSVIGYLGDVAQALFDTSTTAPGALTILLPIIGLAIGAGFVGKGIAYVKGLVWGM